MGPPKSAAPVLDPTKVDQGVERSIPQLDWFQKMLSGKSGRVRRGYTNRLRPFQFFLPLFDVHPSLPAEFYPEPQSVN